VHTRVTVVTVFGLLVPVPVGVQGRGIIVPGVVVSRVVVPGVVVPGVVVSGVVVSGVVVSGVVVSRVVVIVVVVVPRTAVVVVVVVLGRGRRRAADPQHRGEQQQGRAPGDRHVHVGASGAVGWSTGSTLSFPRRPGRIHRRTKVE